jgi:hypothetical protein
MDGIFETIWKILQNINNDPILTFPCNGKELEIWE